MALDDVETYLEPEVGVVVAAVAVLLSPKARRVIRRGAIYGVSGLLAASEAALAVVRRLGPGHSPPATTFLQDLATEAQAEQAKRAGNAHA